MQSSAELRAGYRAFFESKGHTFRPSASLIPRADDRSTLLTTAGMQPLMPFFLGREQPPAPLLTTVQKCFRTDDIDEVGLDGSHLTFFEMLGNFSFGQYFKEGAIDFAWEFVFDHLKIDPERFWVSVFAGDPELGLGEDTVAYDHWVKIGQPTERIVFLPRAENFWSVGGPGPCGPDTEMYYDWGDEHGRGMTFLAADGIAPSNEGRGYVMRRIIRRAVQQGDRVGLEAPYLAQLSDVVIEQMKDGYPELEEHRDEIHRILTAEEERFGRTLERGLRVFEEVAQRGEVISGEDAFRLHDTYGFPLELTRELARERGLGINEEEFTRLMEQQRTRSRAAISKDDRRAAEFALNAGFRTEFVGYEKIEVLTQIGALEDLGDGLFLAKLRESPFYPAGGGQVTDTGWIERDDGSGARAELQEAYGLEEDQALLFEGDGFSEG